MGFTLVIPPALDPISVAEAKSHCRITSAEEDGVLVGYILAARQYVESVTNRVLMTQTLDYFIDRDWPFYFDTEYRCNRRLIELPCAPAQSVTSIIYVDSAGVSQTLAANQYVADVSRSIGRIEPAYGAVWPTVRCQPKAITIRYVAGYGAQPGAIPEPIRQAMLLLIGGWYENRESTVIGQIPSVLPMGVESLLAPYRVFY